MNRKKEKKNASKEAKEERNFFFDGSAYMPLTKGEIGIEPFMPMNWTSADSSRTSFVYLSYSLMSWFPVVDILDKSISVPILDTRCSRR